MAIQQQKLSALLASNVSTIVSSQNKIKFPVSKCFTNINHHSYNKQLIWNRFALHTAGRYVLSHRNYFKIKTNVGATMKEKQPSGKGIEISSQIMSIADELYRSQDCWDDERFMSAIESQLKLDKIEIPEIRDKTTEYYAWCAQHGDIVASTRYLIILKRILDHKQSIPGHHDIRVHEEDLL